jgi:16S rRNA (cytosine1402-N4)-methyltransferase
VIADYHTPVLLDETLSFLREKPVVLDCTLGGGGHTEALLRKGHGVVAIDRDPAAIGAARARLADDLSAGRLATFEANFADIDETAELAGVHFDGILMDLGVSSHQFDSEERGFTFRPGAPLDMRMSADVGDTAADILNNAEPDELQRILHDYADERGARRMASEIVRRRATEPFETSDHLVRAIRGVLGARSGPSDFARIFQAFRMAVNGEVQALQSALPVLRDRLKPSGVMVVISYHSGEDRIVKNAFRDWTRGCICSTRQPFCTCGLSPMGNTLTRKSVVATDNETRNNPRARSARLRAWQRSA